MGARELLNFTSELSDLLASGMKFQVPFELMVVFSTNLNPHDLADEAFLRRIQTKVLVDNVTADSDQVWRNVEALIETWKELRGA